MESNSVIRVTSAIGLALRFFKLFSVFGEVVLLTKTKQVYYGALLQCTLWKKNNFCAYLHYVLKCF